MNKLFNIFSSKILYIWEFVLKNNRNHKVEYWDSRLSGKKKLAVDGKVLTLLKDSDNFYFNFKIDEYIFIVMQAEDEKPRLTINNRDFNDLIEDERTGKLQREKENYNKTKAKKSNTQSESEYYKRAMKYNGENYVEGNDGEIYDIEEQRKRLEEFERKKQKENEEKNKKNKINNNNNDSNKSKKQNKFVLNNETVRKNQIIIQNINNIFDDENLLDLNDINFNQGNNNNNQNNFMSENMFNINNNDYNFSQMNNNMNNNGNNQEVVNQFLSNMDNNNNNYNFINDNNMNETNNYMNQNNNNNKNNYNDDFNPFDD